MKQRAVSPAGGADALDDVQLDVQDCDTVHALDRGRAVSQTPPLTFPQAGPGGFSLQGHAGNYKRSIIYVSTSRSAAY